MSIEGRWHLQRRHRGAKWQRGVTLVELITFVVIVGVAVAGVLAIFIHATQQSADPLVRKQAIAVAESLLEEVMAVPLTCPTGATCASVTISNRTAAHALSDYHGFSMSGISDLQGNSIAGLSGYNASVAVASTLLNGINGYQVTVTVTHAATSQSVTLTGWRVAL